MRGPSMDDAYEIEELRSRLAHMLLHEADPVSTLVTLIDALRRDAYRTGYARGVGDAPSIKRHVDDALGSL